MLVNWKLQLLYKKLTINLQFTENLQKLTEIENKLNDHNHDKYIDTSKFNKFAVDVFNARLTQANLITNRFWC